MSFFSRMFGGGANNPTRLNQVRINQSVLGYPLPVVMGRAVVQQSILWVDGLHATSEGAGKGIGGKGATAYLYTADVIAALCNGPISGVGDVWSGQSWLSNSITNESYTIAGGTPSYAPSNASAFALDHGVSVDNSFSTTHTDLGSGGAVTLAGTDAAGFRRVAFGSTLAAKQYSINPTTSAYNFAAADVGTVVRIAYSFAINQIKQQENDIVPGSKQIQVGGTFTFYQDNGVVYFTGPNDGIALSKVSGTPTVTGTYSVSGSAPATYKFAPGDIGAEVQITYKIQNNSVIPKGASRTLTFSVFLGQLGQSVWSFLTSTFPQAALAYTGIAYVAYNPMTLGMSTDVQQNKFEVITPDAFGSGVFDCNPVQCIKQILTNKVWGLGAGPVPFPPSAIDSAPGGSWGYGIVVDPNAVTSSSQRLSATAVGQTGTDWHNPTAMVAPNGRPGFVAFTNGAGTIYANKFGGGGFNIPSTDVITGILVEWDGSGFDTHGTPVPSVVNISLESSAGVAIVTRTNVTQGASSANKSGGANDQWGAVLTPSIVNTAGFGVSFQAGAGAAFGTVVLNPYITVFHSSAPGARNSGGTAYNWFAANNFFISPVIDHQDSASSLIGKWLEAGMCAAFMSEGMLKLVPYGDTTTAANGCTWTAPTAFAASLDDTCFLPKSKGEDPVKISSSPWQDAYNTVQIQWNNRNNQYAPEITPESDPAAINRYGSRIEDPQSFDFIHTLQAATFSASMRVKRGVYTRNTYEFSLPFIYSFLEPMDVVSISTTSLWAAGTNNVALGVNDLPVRIIKIVDNPGVEGLVITAEDYPFGVHQPSIYNKDLGAAILQQNLYAEPGDSEVVLFEAFSRLTGFQGNQIWMGATGVDENWGSTNVWVSQDGTKYLEVGTINARARLGILDSTMASGSDPDTTHSLVVDLAENSAQLEAGTATDADSGNTLCFVDGEIMAYSAAAITGQDQYTMDTYIRRGLKGSTIAAHAAGSLFLRLDDSVFKFTYDPTWAGKTLHFKFQSVNKWGNSAQDLSTLTAVPFTVPGLNPGTVDASSGLVLPLRTPIPAPPVVGGGKLGWTPATTAPSFVAKTTCVAGTPGTMNTTGASLLVAVLGCLDTGSAVPTITDSKGNTWTYLAAAGVGGGGTATRIAYCINPTVGTGHTFTAGVGYGGFIYAFGNCASYDIDTNSGVLGLNTVPFQPGSITPSKGDLVVMGFFSNALLSGSAVFSIDGGFSGPDRVDTTVSGGASYLLAAPGTAVNPNFGMTVYGNVGASAVIAAFKAA